MKLSSHSVLALTLSLLAVGGFGACASEDQPKAAPAPAAEKQAPAAVADTAEEATPPKTFEEPDQTGEPGALTAFADVDESIGDVPHTVKLDVDVIDGTGNPPFTYVWDFGDATEFSTEKAPTHTYKIPGSFRASVIVTDAKGEIDQDYFDISVNESLPPGAITPEQLMEMMPPGEIAPELKGMEGAIGDKRAP